MNDKATYDLVPQLIFVINVEGDHQFRFLLLNKAYEDEVGLKHEDVTGKLTFEALPYQTAVLVTEKYQQCVEAKAQISYTERLLLAGKVDWWQTTLNPIEKDGEIVQIVGTATRITNRLSIEQQLRVAIEKRHIVAHFQPICEIATAQPVGFEALARWPNSGFYPGDFLPVAKSSNLLRPLTELIISQAGEALSQLPEELWVSVNISEAGFEQHLDEVIGAKKLGRSRLSFEVTEDAAMEHDFVAAAEALKKLGHKIKIDDFGTVNANLDWLTKFQGFDALKIDIAFVKGVGDDKHKQALCRAANQIAISFEMDAIAEGIETKADKEWLIAEGIRYGQGYFFSKPLDAVELGTCFKTLQLN
ncbi:MAG: EAL domain-containing protein [Leptolyngbyaceae cyanobacterium]